MKLIFENWRKYIINEDLEVVLTNEEAGELFGEEVEKQLNASSLRKEIRVEPLGSVEEEREEYEAAKAAEESE